MTIVKKFLETAEKRPQQTAVISISNNQQYEMSWTEVLNQCCIYAGVLKDLGIKKKDHVLIFSDTCKDWGFLDMAIMAVGAVTVPVYHSSHPQDIEHIVSHSEGKVIFVQNRQLLLKLKTTKAWESLETVILMDDTQRTSHKKTTSRSKSDKKNSANALSLESLSKTTKACPLADISKGLKLSDTATIIYTSGTSGTPKGIVLTHTQILSCVSDTYPLQGITHSDRSLTFLPFSHILGRQELWGHYYTGFTMGYAQSIDRIKKNLGQIQPTVFVGVPRIFEKIFYGIQAQVQISPLKKRLFQHALNVGQEISNYQSQRKSPPFSLLLKHQIAQKTVFAPIQKKMGGRLRLAVSGGAPLDSQISSFFRSCGIPLLEGYGLSESTGPIFVNTLFHQKLGTVGKAIGDVDVRFDTDGEILVKSDKIMKSYFKDDAATKKVFTEDGFFRTGDIGELDEEGFLKITDRKKDLIKTAGGKFVAPQKLQKMFSTSPLVSFVHVHGDKKKYVVALLTLDPDALKELKHDKGLQDLPNEDVVKNPEIRAEVRREVSRVNKNLASFETIKRYKILDHEFSIEAGLLTPSLKMKRKKIDAVYAKEIEALYL